MKKGISLIILCITIIIMLILAGVVITTFSKTNTVSKAKEAVFKQDMANMQEVLAVKLATMLAEGNVAESSVTALDKTSVKKYIEDLPKKYEDRVSIVKGKLCFDGEIYDEIRWSEDMQIGKNKNKKPKYESKAKVFDNLSNEVVYSKIITQSNGTFIAVKTNADMSGDASIVLVNDDLSNVWECKLERSLNLESIAGTIAVDDAYIYVPYMYRPENINEKSYTKLVKINKATGKLDEKSTDIKDFLIFHKIYVDENNIYIIYNKYEEAEKTNYIQFIKLDKDLNIHINKKVEGVSFSESLMMKMDKSEADICISYATKEKIVMVKIDTNGKCIYNVEKDVKYKTEQNAWVYPLNYGNTAKYITAYRGLGQDKNKAITYLTELDSSGAVIEEKEIIPRYNIGDIKKTKDNNIYITGSKLVNKKNISVVIKTDKNMKKIWEIQSEKDNAEVTEVVDYGKNLYVYENIYTKVENANDIVTPYRLKYIFK
ncbi:MAG: hypothetical protein RR594_00435 [Clostridia bacterium]